MNLLMNSQYVCLHVYNYDLQLIKNCLSMTTRLEHDNYRCRDKNLTVIKNIMIKEFFFVAHMNWFFICNKIITTIWFRKIPVFKLYSIYFIITFLFH